MEYKITIDDKEYVSKNQYISGKKIKKIGKIDSTHSIWFKAPNSDHAIEMRDDDTLDLSHPGIEHFYSKAENPSWIYK
jgi:hypothetical protein